MKVTINGNAYKVHFSIEPQQAYPNYSKREVTCFIVPKDPSTSYKGTAFCLPGDNFHPTIGRKIALKRALANTGCTKEERAEIWNSFLVKYRQPLRQPTLGSARAYQQEIQKLREENTRLKEELAQQTGVASRLTPGSRLTSGQAGKALLQQL